jgi:hypothetical protein
MKLLNNYSIPLPFVVLLSLLACSSVHAHDDHDHANLTCTYGKLFVADADTGTTVHVIELNSGHNFTHETSLEVSGGVDGVDLIVSANSAVVGALYYGAEAANYTGGVTTWIHTGAEVEEDGTVGYDSPMILPNAGFQCEQPTHVTYGGEMVAFFCDGNYPLNRNSTIWILDESKLNAASMNENAIMYNTTVQSSHHGYAVVFADNRLLYSVPTPDRISRNVNGSDDELATTFVVTDLTGNVVHTIDNTGDVNTHCSGLHGNTNLHHTSIFACDEVHGGVLIISYDEGSDTFSSRALAYPVEGHRSFSLEQHSNASHIVGDLLVYDPEVGLSSIHLFAFSTDDTELMESHVLKLPTEQYPCGYSYEKSEGEFVLVMLADGLLLAYEFESKWTELARLQVVSNMTSCDQVAFTTGYSQAFVLTTEPGNATLHAIDLSEVHSEGKMAVYATSSLDFTPYSPVVAGVPPNTGCTGHEGKHGSDDDLTNSNSTGTSAGVTTATSAYNYMAVEVMSTAIAGVVALMA